MKECLFDNQNIHCGKCQRIIGHINNNILYKDPDNYFKIGSVPFCKKCTTSRLMSENT